MASTSISTPATSLRPVRPTARSVCSPSCLFAEIDRVRRSTFGISPRPTSPTPPARAPVRSTTLPLSPGTPTSPTSSQPVQILATPSSGISRASERSPLSATPPPPPPESATASVSRAGELEEASEASAASNGILTTCVPPRSDSSPYTDVTRAADSSRHRFRRRSQSRHHALGFTKLEGTGEGSLLAFAPSEPCTDDDAQILAGHDKGILSLSWCDQDADLLLSSGKDGRTICWNPSSGDIVAEVRFAYCSKATFPDFILSQVTPSSNWSFDVQWCPRNPSMLSTASLDGKISIHSIQDTSSPAQIDLAASSSLAPGVDGAGLFDQAISANAANYPTKSLTQTPKWLKRPASATFGFGGKVVLVSNQAGASSVTVRTVAGEQDIVAKAVRLEQAFEGRTLAAFCEERSVEVSRGSLAPGVREGEAASWKLLGTLFGAESKGELVSLLGFSKAEIKAKVEEAIKSLKDKISSSSIGMSKTQSSGAISTGSDLENDSASVAREPLVTFADTPNDGLSASSQGEASAANRRSGSLLDGDGHGTSLGGRDSELTEPSLFGPEDPAAPGTPGTQQRAAADFYSLIGSGRPAALPDHVFQRDAIANSSVAATVGSASSVASLSLKPTTFKIYPAEENEVDRLITRALVLGDFESAVELSLSAERFADAILLAVRGGPELLVKTQKTYFERQTSSLPYLRVFQSIVTNDLSDVVQNADLSEWQEIFVVLCTFAGPDEFSSLVEQLGQRLEYQFTVARNSPSPDFAPELRRNAILCYLAAGKLEKVVGIWIQQMKEEEAAAKAKDTRNGSTVQLATSKYSAHAAALQTFVEKVTVFQQAVGYVDEDLAHSTPTDTLTPRIYKLGALYDCYVEYADLLASQGLVHVAVKYMNQTPRDFQGSEQKDEFGPALTRDRIARASGQRANTNAFPTGLKIGADPAPAAAPYVAPAQSTSTYGYQSQQQSYPSNSYSSNQSYPSIASVQQSSYAAPPAPMPQTNAYGSMPPAQQQRGYDDPYAQASTNAYPAPPSNPYQQNPSPYSSTPSYPSQPNYSNGASQYATPSPYGASQSFIPAPPAPLDGAPTLAGRAPSNNMPPPPPRAKNDVQWNDAPPPKDARKATTPAPPSKPSAITSPFPNSSAMSSPPLGYGQPGNVPPPPPSRGSSRTPLQPAPPPPRSGQGFPPPPPLPRSGMSPPPPPPGYQNQQQRFAPGPPPPPPGPPRPPQQQNQQQSQQPGMNYPPHLSSQQQQFRGAPTPPPNAPYGRAPGTTFGPPPPPPLHYGQPPPRQTAAQQQQQQPVQAHPPPGPYSPAPGAVRSTGPPLSRRNTASPAPPPPAPIRAEPPKTKYPAGDRAHIPEANRPILNILSNEIGRLKQITPVSPPSRVAVEQCTDVSIVAASASKDDQRYRKANQFALRFAQLRDSLGADAISYPRHCQRFVYRRARSVRRLMMLCSQRSKEEIKRLRWRFTWE